MNTEETKTVLTGVFVSARTGVEVVQFEPKLEWYYKHLECQYIDIAEREIGGVIYDIICDDEGLLVENPIPTACDHNGRPMLFGNLLICHHDDEGNETGLTEEEAENIVENFSAGAIVNGEPIHLLACVEYPRY